jgi:SseB protein C-terminal domain
VIDSRVFELLADKAIRVQVGLPAEEPTEALALLIEHFKGRPQVRSAVIGLMRFLEPNSPVDFTYTIGLTCATDQQREAEEGFALAALQAANINSVRWPISFLPPRTRYFSPQASTFYPAPPPGKPPGLFRRLFG